MSVSKPILSIKAMNKKNLIECRRLSKWPKKNTNIFIPLWVLLKMISNMTLTKTKRKRVNINSQLTKEKLSKTFSDQKIAWLMMQRLAAILKYGMRWEPRRWLQDWRLQLKSQIDRKNHDIILICNVQLFLSVLLIVLFHVFYFESHYNSCFTSNVRKFFGGQTDIPSLKYHQCRLRPWSFRRFLLSNSWSRWSLELDHGIIGDYCAKIY